MLRIFIIGHFFAPLLLPVIIFTYIFLNQYTAYFKDDLWLDIGLWGRYPLKQNWWMVYISGLIVFLNAFILNRLFNRNNFSEKTSWIVGLLYVVLMSFYHAFYIVDGALIAHFFLILCLYQLFDLESNLDGRRACFNSGIFLGVAASFHPVLIFILPFLWLMITSIRPFVLREMVLATIGFLVPMIYGFSVVFYQKSSINWNFIETTVNYSQKEILFFIYVGLFAVASLVGIIGFRNKLVKSSIRFRKLAAVITLCLLAGILIGVLQYLFLRKYEWFSFGMLAMSLFLAFSFFNKKTVLVASILLYAIVGFSIAKFFV